MSPHGLHLAYSWCSDAWRRSRVLLGEPNLINAKKIGAGSWRIPDEPKFDDQLVLAIVLAESATCD